MENRGEPKMPVLAFQLMRDTSHYLKTRSEGAFEMFHCSSQKVTELDLLISAIFP